MAPVIELTELFPVRDRGMLVTSLGMLKACVTRGTGSKQWWLSTDIELDNLWPEGRSGIQVRSR